MTPERWLPVPGWEDLYEVSDQGRVRSRDRVARSLETSRLDDRDADGAARQMVAAGGNAVVPQVAEHIGRLIMTAAAS